MRIGARAPMHPRRLVSHQPGIGRVMDRLLTCIAAAAGARFACAGFPVSAVFRRRDHGAHMAASWRECAADIAPEARPCAGVRGGARSPGRFDCRGRQERRPRRTRQTHQAHQAHQAHQTHQTHQTHQMRQTANRKPQTPNPKPQTPILFAIDSPSGDWPNRPLRPCESTSHPARGRRIRSPGTQAGISFYPPFAVFSRSTSRDARNRCSAEKSRR